MKNLRWVLFFAAMILVIPLMAQVGVDAPPEIKTGLMAKVWTWFVSQGQGFLGGLVFAFAAKQGWTLIIKKVASKGALITKELGELMADSSVLLSAVDKSIKEDGSIDQNSVKEVLAAGKEVYVELKDVAISIKPK
jgi:hypothetical protein